MVTTETQTGHIMKNAAYARWFSGNPTITAQVKNNMLGMGEPQKCDHFHRNPDGWKRGATWIIRMLNRARRPWQHMAKQHEGLSEQICVLIHLPLLAGGQPRETIQVLSVPERGRTPRHKARTRPSVAGGAPVCPHEEAPFGPLHKPMPRTLDPKIALFSNGQIVRHAQHGKAQSITLSFHDIVEVPWPSRPREKMNEHAGAHGDDRRLTNMLRPLFGATVDRVPRPTRP